MGTTVKPYIGKKEGKKEQVTMMFNNISRRYDFLNRFLSAGIDRIWRKKAINFLVDDSPDLILDVASGTGDLALEAMRLKPVKIIGVDISALMLEEGRQKIARLGLSDRIELQVGDAENLNFHENYFDAVTVAFGVRNFENLEAGLKEINRVLKPGGKLVVLEFSRPTGILLKPLFGLYFRYVLPVIGAIVSRDRRAYRYLHDSVEAFPQGNEFNVIMKSCGFENHTSRRLMSGIATIYVGKK